jgi:putative membrane protein
MMTGIGMGFGGIGLILMVIFWGALIFGGVWLVKSLFTSSQENQGRRGLPQQQSAREILDQRYARGEIGREEYERIKADLT